MSKVGESLLKGAEEALAYAKGLSLGHRIHQARMPRRKLKKSVRKFKMPTGAGFML